MKVHLIFRLRLGVTVVAGSACYSGQKDHRPRRMSDGTRNLYWYTFDKTSLYTRLGLAFSSQVVQADEPVG